jgi:hypothetical protein
VATIRAGKASITVTPGVDVTNGSFVLLTPRADIGQRALSYTIDPAAKAFRIRMSSSRGRATPVAWLLLG